MGENCTNEITKQSDSVNTSHEVPTILTASGNIQQSPSANYYNVPHCSSCQQNVSFYDSNRCRSRNNTMSPVRRFFCLFVTFDLMLTSLIWLISLVLAGEFNFYIVIKKEILHYNVKSSSFDVVMASFVRFVVLLLFYALLRINHWIIVAITTASTCLFLVAKVCLFDWESTAKNQVLEVLLILSSFILSWAEAWLLDIRVIPHERRAELAPPNYDERSPLLQNYTNINSHFDALSESIVSFYSPAGSSDDSGDECDRRSHRRVRTTKTIMNENYQTRGEEILEAAWQILNNDDWLFELDTPDGDQVHSQKLAKGQKIFRLTGILNIPKSTLQELLFNRIEDFPQWNPTVKEAKIVQVMDPCTDITLQVSAEAGNGLIACREFVTLRFCKCKYGHTIIASASVTWPSTSSDNSLIRGENGPGCWAIKKISDQQCEVRWLLNTRVNGWLPQYAVDSVLASVMTENMSYLRKYISSTIAHKDNTESSAEEVNK